MKGQYEDRITPRYPGLWPHVSSTQVLLREAADYVKKLEAEAEQLVEFGLLTTRQPPP